MSNFINSRFNKNFRTLINEYRIGHVKKEIANKHLSLEEISLKTGFKSYTTFLRVFKENVGLSPTEFRNNQYKK
jgi:AraC-like DNA-binding protein